MIYYIFSIDPDQPISKRYRTTCHKRFTLRKTMKLFVGGNA
jgi:hypothetical protein